MVRLARSDRCLLLPAHLKKTVSIALLVGTALFCVNQLSVVLGGDATTLVWAKVAITYLVPFANANAGVLIATSCQPDDVITTRVSAN